MIIGGTSLIFFMQLACLVALYWVYQEVRLNGHAIERMRKLLVKMYYDGGR